MKKSFLIAVLLILGTIFLVQASAPPRAEAGVFTNILFYIPNRVFDVLDIVRLRLRVGPGISVGVRATKPLTAFIGPHMTVWAGLPGPRGNPGYHCLLVLRPVQVLNSALLIWQSQALTTARWKLVLNFSFSCLARTSV